MKININSEEFTKGFHDELNKRNIFYNKDNIAEHCIATWAFILNDMKSFDDPIEILTDTNFSYVNNGKILFVSSESPTWTKMEKNKILSYYMSNALGRKVDVSFDNTQNHNKTFIEAILGQYDLELIVGIISILPKIFTEISINEDKIKMLNELKSKNFRGINELCKYTMEKIGAFIESISSNILMNSLNNCMLYVKKTKICSLENIINDLRKEMEEIQLKYSSIIERYNRRCEELRLETTKADIEGESEKVLKDLLLKNPVIQNVSVRQSILSYQVYTYLDYYDMDIFKTITENSSIESIYVLNDIHTTKVKKADALWLINRIFKDRDYKIRVYGQFELNFNSAISKTLKNIRGNLCIVDGYMPSPHGQMFNCVGTFPEQWNEAIASGDIYMAISYTIAYTQNINWGDGVVSKAFITYLMREAWEEKVLEDKNGNLLSPREAIEQRKE